MEQYPDAIVANSVCEVKEAKNGSDHLEIMTSELAGCMLDSSNPPNSRNLPMSLSEIPSMGTGIYF
jgi:hypothetical protein